MRPITYVTGDATEPIGDGFKVIAHCCNDIGAWGAGFVLALSRKWPEPEDAYREMGLEDGYSGGTVCIVSVAPQIKVANIIGQHGCHSNRMGHPPVRYDWIRVGLGFVRCDLPDHSVHMPRIGCGLAGGDWSVMERVIEETLCAHDVAVYVYDLPRKHNT